MTRSTIKRIPGTDVLELRFAGETAYRACIEALDELQTIWPGAGSSRLLVNFTSAWPSRSPFAFRGQATFAEKLSRVRCAARTRVALLNPFGEDGSTDTMAARAKITLRRFADRDIAIEWLRVPRSVR